MPPEQPNQSNGEPPFRTDPIPPDLLAWVRQTYTEEDFLREKREMEESGGGLPLEAFIAEVEAAARGE